MKKVLITCFIAITCIALIFGKIHYNNKIEATGNQAKNDFIKDIEKEKNEHQKLLDSLNPDLNKNQSIMDYLHYKALTQNQVTISLIGSSVTQGSGASNADHSWAGLLGSSFQSANSSFHNVTIKNHGVGGYTTQHIINNNIIDTVVKDNPDLVIFETCLLNNHGQSITMNDTFNQINQIYSALKGKLPKTKILLISANPAPSKTEKTLNTLSLSYQNYIDKTSEYITSQHWEYVNIYQGMEEKITKENIDLKNTSKDGTHPNDDGYSIWFEVLSSYMNTKH